MYKGLKKISTVDMSREEWLEHRRKSIGGSDAASVVGLNKYASPYSLWADKRGLLPEKQDSEPMRLGRDLEDYVAKRFTEETGKRVRRERNIIINPDIPFAHANVDRLIIGEDAGLECKTTSALNTKRFKGGEYPTNYYVQCVHYMMVTGAARWYLAVLVLGVGFYWYCIERDEAEIEALRAAESDFWEMVDTNTPPPVDGLTATTEAVSAVLGASTPGETCDLTAVHKDLDLLFAKKAELATVKAEVDEIENRVKVYMDSSERGESDRFIVVYAEQSRRTFDTNRFAGDHPDIDLSDYYKVSTTRSFRAKIR